MHALGNTLEAVNVRSLVCMFYFSFVRRTFIIIIMNLIRENSCLAEKKIWKHQRNKSIFFQRSTHTIYQKHEETSECNLRRTSFVIRIPKKKPNCSLKIGIPSARSILMCVRVQQAVRVSFASHSFRCNFSEVYDMLCAKWNDPKEKTMGNKIYIFEVLKATHISSA